MPKDLSPIEEEKIVFLRKIQQIAEANPNVIGEGKLLFLYDSEVFDEKCYISVHLTRSIKSFLGLKRYDSYDILPSEVPLEEMMPETIEKFFRKNKSQYLFTYDPESVLFLARRYLPENIRDFKSEFHLFKGAGENSICLLDRIK